MKFLKRFITIAFCALITAACFSGCNMLSSGFNSCKHVEGEELKFDSSSHYYECVKCGAKCRPRDHIIEVRHDDNDHFNGCIICDYADDSTRAPHVLGEWGTFSRAENYRPCTDPACNYKAVCDHTEINEDDEEYVIKNGQHALACKKCKMLLTYRYNKNTGANYKYALQDHRYNQYKDVTEQTHVAHCVCGQIKGAAEPHVLRFRGENGYHGNTCDCGFGEEKQSCNYETAYNTSSHFEKCTDCGDIINSSDHTIEYIFGARECRTCGYVNRFHEVLIGKWVRQLSYSNYYYAITFNSNWTYEVRYGKNEALAEVTSSGKYDYNGIFIDFENTSGESVSSLRAEETDAGSGSFKVGNATYVKQ